MDTQDIIILVVFGSLACAIAIFGIFCTVIMCADMREMQEIELRLKNIKEAGGV